MEKKHPRQFDVSVVGGPTPVNVRRRFTGAAPRACVGGEGGGVLLAY